MFLEFNLLFEPLCVNRLKGSTLADRLAMSNTVSPGVNSILSRISSRFSSGYFSRDVLFVEYTALMYHVLPAGIRFVVRFQWSDTIFMSPSSDAFIVFVLAFSPCATEYSSSSVVRVVGFMVTIRLTLQLLDCLLYCQGLLYLCRLLLLLVLVMFR